MLNSGSGASCATDIAAPRSSQPGAVGSSSLAAIRQIEGDKFRVRNAITRCWHRMEAAKRRSDNVEAADAQDDLDRLSNQLAALHAQARDLGA